MSQSSSMIDAAAFRKVLARNVALPLGLGIAGAAVFVAMILYLLSVINWVEHTDRVMNDGNELSKLAVDQEASMRGYLISGDAVYLPTFESSRAQFARGVADLKALVLDNPPQVSRLNRIEQAQAEWHRYASGLVEERKQGRDFQKIVQTGQGKRLTDTVRSEFSAFLAEESRLRVLRNEQAQGTATFVLVGYVIFSVVLSITLAVFGRRELKSLSGSYGSALDEQVKHAETLQMQAWLREGQSRLAEQIIGHHNVGALGQSALDFLSQYMGFAVGALYLRGADGQLVQAAGYGLPPPGKDASGNVKPVAAGALSLQAAESKRPMLLDKLPAGYLQLESGVAKGDAQSALIVPLINDGDVNGVIEVGFMRTLDPRDADLLRLVSASLGAAVGMALYRQRLQDTLSQTQQLNEELQVQQEELRVANEELEEQSRVLKESQAQLQSQQAELEQTNEQLSEQALALDQRNLALRRAQDDLREHADELQRASRYKSEFLANMSHELRTPLNSSLILARLLADNTKGTLDAEQVRFAESIYSAGNDLLNLINDILDISKVEAGRLDIVVEDVRTDRLVDSLRQTFEPIASKKQLAFEVELADGTAPVLRTDRQRAEQIIKNLLSNAIKFTDKGRVVLKVGPGKEGGVDFAVHDTGIGIAPTQHEMIFEAFRQADGTTSRKYGGTGLGLSISRDLAHLLGGDITIESEAGQGSVFTLHMPLAQEAPLARDESPRARPAPAEPALNRNVATYGSAHASAPVVAAPSPGNEIHMPLPAFPDDRDTPIVPEVRCVLVIEDEPQFAHILYDLAHERSYRCIVAHGAEEGLAMARQYVPDAILLDMRLPDRPGLNVLQGLKDDPRTRHIPVHIISAQDNREAALHLGAVGYALKPASREQLTDIFRQFETRLTQRLKHVLLVEDDDRQRDSVVQLIGDEDVEITAVATGAEALAALQARVFDCMIIDLKLPDMEGSQLLERMSHEDIKSFPPVIVYTGRVLTREEEQKLLRYSRSIIIKGARSPERLLDEVTLFLHKVESELSAERQTMLRNARSREKVFEGRRILLADDDVRNVFALTSALEQRGLKVEVARDGHEALEKLDKVNDIDLVLMDVMMPGMDGLEATRRIRGDARFKNMPIIAVTAKAMKDDQEQCLAAGANDYLAKPVDLDRLFSLLRVWLPRLERF